jgi:predicted transcriptional regulator
MKDFVCSTTEFAERVGIEYIVASSVLRFLQEKGHVQEEGVRPPKGGKGKPTKLYRVPENITLDFAKVG